MSNRHDWLHLDGLLDFLLVPVDMLRTYNDAYVRFDRWRSGRILSTADPHDQRVRGLRSMKVDEGHV